MKLKEYLTEQGRKAALAKAIGVAPSYMWQMANGAKPVPVTRCAAIEKATGGAVSRRDLRPDDWHEIWPELVGGANGTASIRDMIFSNCIGHGGGYTVIDRLVVKGLVEVVPNSRPRAVKITRAGWEVEL